MKGKRKGQERRQTITGHSRKVGGIMSNNRLGQVDVCVWGDYEAITGHGGKAEGVSSNNRVLRKVWGGSSKQ